MVVWLTGLSGSGKTTIAELLRTRLSGQWRLVYILDGDTLRSGLNSDLGFTLEDRKENVRRTAEVAKILSKDLGYTVLVAMITPTDELRELARSTVGRGFRQIYVKCSLEICEQRDVKGLYKRARAGEIKLFTGIDDPFEEPACPDGIVNTEKLSPEECIEKILRVVWP